MRPILLAVAPLVAALSTLQAGAVRSAPAITACSSITATDVVFGDYDTISKPQLRTTGTLVAVCTGNGAGTANLTVELGAGASGRCAQRAMSNGALSANYTLFSDANVSAAWCGTFTQQTTVPAANVPFTTTFTVYGLVPSGQTLAVGDYADTVIAATATGGVDAVTSFRVTTHVPGVCSLSASSLPFGDYTGAQLDGTAVITVNCSHAAAYTVALDRGANASGATRRMSGPGLQTLSYQLYSDAPRTSPWGDGSGFGAPVSGVGTGADQALIVYGRVPAGQLATPGSYADTVVVTLNY